MMTEKVTFVGNNDVSVARKQVEEQAPPLRKYWPEAPDALQGIIDKALAKNLQDRYATAEDMKNDLMRVKNLIYPSKNNEMFLDQTIPLQAIATTSPVKAATAAAPGSSKARSRSDEEKYQTLIMSLPSFLTREVDDDTSEYEQFEEPESTRKVVAVTTEPKEADTGAGASDAAVLGAAVAAMGASEPEQQSLFTEDTDIVTATKKAESGSGRDYRDGGMDSGNGLNPSETVKEPEGKPVVIPVADINGASKPEIHASGVRSAGAELSVAGTPAVAVAARKEGPGSLEPEQGKKNDKPKNKSGFLKKLIAAVLLLFVLIAGGIFYFFGSSKPEIAVPDVNGKPVAEAQQALEAQGFKVEIENKVDTSVKPGIVLRMDPVAGIKRKEGATITLVVSGTEKTIAVPKVVGLKQEQAEKLLAEKKLRIEKIEYKWEQDKPEGIILSQSPEEKSQLGENGAVNVVINKKEEKNVAVPDLKGMTLAEARKKLENLKLKVEVREEDSEKNKDTVIGMSPDVSDTITEGSTVVLLVSNAKKQAGFPATPDKISSNSGKSNGSVTVNKTTGARYAEFVVPGTGTHTVQIVSNNGRSQKVEVSGSYNGGVRLRTKVDSDVQRVGFYVDHRLVEEKSW